MIVDHCLSDENGRNYAIQSCRIDITERKHAEEEQRLLEIRYRSLFDKPMTLSSFLILRVTT